MKRIALGLGCALMLAAFTTAGPSGCASASKVTSNEAVLGSTVVDEKALFFAQAAMVGADTAAQAAVRNGLIQPSSPTAISVADALEGAHKALVVARQAYKLGDAKTFTEKIGSVQTLISVAWALIPQKPEVSNGR